jgi:hypothetical protein
MRGKTLFICYSHRDQKYFDRLRIHLKPYEDEEQLLVWTDQELMVGDDWDGEIEERLKSVDVALLLVSADMLASDYVTGKEIPRLMERAEEGRLLFVPLFVGAAKEDRIFPVVDRTTGKQGIPLSKYQGLNQPSNPLDQLPESQQDELLRDGLRRLTLAAGDAEPIGPQIEGELTVRLEERNGGKGVRRVFTRAGSMSDEEFRLDPLLATRGGPARERGEALFEALLGASWQQILSRTWRKGPERIATPLLHGLRVRILSRSERIRSLPWGTTTWQGNALAHYGWTFEIGVRENPPSAVHLDTPCKVLMIGAGKQRADLAMDAHQKDLASLLAEAWNRQGEGQCLEFVDSSEALFEALQKEPYPLIYIYGETRTEGDEIAFRLGEEDLVPLAEIQNRTRYWLPQAVVLNTETACPAVTLWPGVPLLLHIRSDNRYTARRMAQDWWARVLRDEASPVPALFSNRHSAYQSAHISTDYRRWETERHDYLPKVDRARQRLDRRSQRQAVRGALGELVRKPNSRVTAILAFGAAGNMVQNFMEQVHHTVEDEDKDLARLERKKLSFPRGRGNLRLEDFAQEVREAFQLQPTEELTESLHTHTGGGRATPVIVLDWGTYPNGDHKPLRTVDLEVWVRFAQDLAESCPGHLRILSYVALKVEPDKQEILRKVGEELGRYRTERFDFHPLPALDHLSADDLHRFLKEEENTSCPKEFLPDIGEKIILKTGGEFRKTVEWLEEAERELRWHEMYRDLPQLPERDAVIEDQEL